VIRLFLFGRLQKLNPDLYSPPVQNLTLKGLKKKVIIIIIIFFFNFSISLMWSRWLNCTSEKSVVFMDCHCSLFLIGTLDFLATFEGVCGGCSIPSLTLTLVRSAYHHQINGKMEVVNDSLGDLLQSLVVIISSLEIMNYFKRNSLTIGL
jgi:hypothetical protein